LLLADALSERVYKTGAPLSAFAAFRQRAPSTSRKRLVSEAEGLSRSESPPHGGAPNGASLTALRLRKSQPP
jgi:hypothetical protein